MRPDGTFFFRDSLRIMGQLGMKAVLFPLFRKMVHSFKPSQKYAVNLETMLRDKATHETAIFSRFASRKLVGACLPVQA
jgi:hypothetical protein